MIAKYVERLPRLTGPTAPPGSVMTALPEGRAGAAVEDAMEALRRGRPVLVVDAADRENEGDVVLAAETVTAEWMAWTVRHTSGYRVRPDVAGVVC
ncbi:MAG: 3,4-dihydroxy-2-butanone-4-phosphate synthase [Hymenobacter sp.]